MRSKSPFSHVLLGAVLATGLVASANAQFVTDITNNPGFETGRGSTPLGNPYLPSYPNWQLFAVDQVGGDYNPLNWRDQNLSEVRFFVPGQPARDQANTFSPVTTYRPFDWWFGEGADFVDGADVADVLNPPGGYVNQVSPLSGSRMLRFKGTGAKLDETCSVYQDFYVANFADSIALGTTSVDVIANFNKNAEDDQAGARLEISFYDASKGLISTSTGPIEALDSDPGTWEPIMHSASVPTNARYMRVHMAAVGQNMLKWGIGNTSGGAYIGTYADDVSVVVTSDLPEQVIVENPGFETPVVGTEGFLAFSDADYWTTIQGAGGRVDPTLVQVPGGTPEGTQAGIVREGAIAQTTTDVFEADTIYYVRASIGALVGTPVGTVLTAGLYSAGAGSDKVQLTSVANSPVNFASFPAPAPGTFTTIELQHVVRAGDPLVGTPVGIYFQQNGTSSSAMAVDDIHVYKVPLIGSIDPIPVPNFSFENPDVADGATAAVASWNGAGPVVYDPLPVADVVPTDGSQTLRFSGSSAIRVALVGVALKPNTNYTLSFDTARATAGSGTVRAMLYYGPGPGLVGANELARTQLSLSQGASLPGLPLADLAFGEGVFTFTTPDLGSLPPAANLIVNLQNANSGTVIHVDNVRLTETPSYQP